MGALVVAAFLLAALLLLAVKDHVQPLGRQLLNGVGELELMLPRDGFDLLEGCIVAVLAQGHEAALVDAQRPVRDDLVDVRAVELAQAAAGLAVAVGAVEGEGIGARLFVGNAVLGVHQVFREGIGLAGFHVLDEEQSVAHFQGGLHGFAQALPAVGLHFDAVHDQFDVV